MEGNGGQVRAEGTTISSTGSDDVDMMDGQDQETVPGSGTHLGGLVAQKRTEKVPMSWSKCDVSGVVVHVTDCEPAMHDGENGEDRQGKLELPW
jgi:hypothetical protein